MDYEQSNELYKVIEKVSSNTHYVAIEVENIGDILKDISAYLERIAMALEDK